MNLPSGLLLCTADGAVLAGDDATRRRLAAHGALRADADAGREDGIHVDAEPVAWGERRCLLVQAGSVSGHAELCRGAARAIVQRVLLEGLVHDLRSPLNSIAMNAEMLRFSRESNAASPAREQRQDRYVAAISNEATRLGRAVSALVDLLEGVGVMPGEGAVARLLATVERFVAPALRMRQVDLRVEIPPHAPPLARTEGLVLAVLALVIGVAENAGPGTMLHVAVTVGERESRLDVAVEPRGAGTTSMAGTGARLEDGERGTLLLVATRLVNGADGRVELGTGDALGVVIPAAA